MVKKDYDTIAEEFDRSRHYTGKEFTFFNAYLEPQSVIVDLGCGNGRLVQYLDEYFNKKGEYKYLGIDNNTSLLNKANGRFGRPGQVIFLSGDQLSIPLEDRSADLCFNIRAFHHIPGRNNRLAVLAETERILKPGGYAIFTVWNLWQFKYFKFVLAALLRFIYTFGAYAPNDTFIPWGKNVKRYYHAFLPVEIRHLLKKSGLELKEIIYAKKDIRTTFFNCHDLIFVAQKCEK